ncbi:hypothetical protein SAMN04487781_0827 [Cellulosimicrobium cellulans]|nr:hypothetical protein SAMN04487781_0827 [Cellulosimicrobium cellulans]
MSRRSWTTRSAASAAVLAIALSGCTVAADSRKAERAAELGCDEVPTAVADAVEAALSDEFTLGEGSTGFEREGRWLVAAPLVDAEGITENAAFAVDLAARPAAVTAESGHAQKASTAPAGSTAGAADVLDCVFSVS